MTSSFVAITTARALDVARVGAGATCKISSVRELLATDMRSHGLLALIEHDAIALWASLLSSDRPAFLRRLSQLGLTNLSDRQRIANILARACKAGRITAADLSVDGITASDALRAAESACARLMSELAAVGADERAARLSRIGLPSSFADNALSGMHASSDMHALLSSAPPLRITRALEAACALPPEIARVLPLALQYAHLRVAFYVVISEEGEAEDIGALDYAEYGERLLGFKAYLVVRVGQGAASQALVDALRGRYVGRLHVLGLCEGLEVLEEWSHANRITHLYVYKVCMCVHVPLRV